MLFETDALACSRSTDAASYVAAPNGSSGTRNPSLPVALESQLFADLPFVESYDDLAVYNGGGGGLGVDLDHLLHGFEVGAYVLLGELDGVTHTKETSRSDADARGGKMTRKQPATGKVL